MAEVPAKDGTAYKFADLDGVIQNNNTYSDFDDLENLYCFARSDVSGLWGVVDGRSGKEIIPCEAVCFKPLSERFFLICYYLSPAKEQEQFAAYRDKETLETICFKGYGKVFDCETGNFVPNLKFSANADNITANAAFVFEYIEDGRIKAYTENGSLHDTYEMISLAPKSSSFLAIKNYVDDEFLVINDRLATSGRIFSQINDYSLLNGSDKFLLHYINSLGGSKRQEVSDLHGHAVSRIYGNIKELCNDKYIIATDAESGKYGVDDINRSNIIPFKYDEIHYQIEGYFQCHDEKGWHLFDTNGNQISSQAFYFRKFLLSNHSLDNHHTVLFYNGTVKNCYGPIENCAKEIIHIGNTIYNALDGSVLLTDVVKLTEIGGKIYITDLNKNITVYSVQ